MIDKNANSVKGDLRRAALPAVVRIEPASSCNLKCSHCPTGLGHAPKGIMKMTIFNKVLEDLIQYGHLVSTVVLYHGGEPLLNKNLGQMIVEVKKTEVGKVKIVSNGKNLNTEWANILIDSGLDELEISLDSIGPDESDLVRRKSDSKMILNNIKNLLRLRSLSDSKLVIKIASTQFVDDYSISSISDLTDPPIPRWLSSAESGLEVKSTWAIQWPGGLPDSQAIVFSQNLENTPETCSLLEETVTVRADGSVVVCCYDLTSKSNMGNVNDDSLSSIWLSTRYKDFRNGFAQGEYETPCDSCSVVIGRSFIGRNQITKVGISSKN